MSLCSEPPEARTGAGHAPDLAAGKRHRPAALSDAELGCAHARIASR